MAAPSPYTTAPATSWANSIPNMSAAPAGMGLPSALGGQGSGQNMAPAYTNPLYAAGSGRTPPGVAALTAAGYGGNQGGISGYPTWTGPSSGSNPEDAIAGPAFQLAGPQNLGQFLSNQNPNTTQVSQVELGGMPQNGLYGSNLTQGQVANAAAQRWSLQNMPDYGDYQALGTTSQNYGQAAAQYLNNPTVNAAMGMQGQLAGGTKAQAGSLGLLGQTAGGYGQAQQAANAQMQAGLNQAQAQAQAQAASTRGNMGLANAQANAQGAQATSAQQAANQAAQLRASMAAQAQGQYATAANQGAQVQGANTAELAQMAGNQQQLAMNYYTGQQSALQEQQQMAANLAQAQLSADYGLSGIGMQTGTQQNIANQNQTMQYVGAGLSALGTFMSDERLKTDVQRQGNVADALLGAFSDSASVYRYKSDADQPTDRPRPGQRYGGIMAQALERVPEIGPGLVRDTPRGKAVEIAPAVGASMMALGRLNSKVEALKAALGVRRAA